MVRMIYMLLKKSLEMFNLSKSPQDLQDKTSVQHKVLCDWLRNLHEQNIQLARKLTILQRTVESMFPSGEQDVNDLEDK